MPGVLRMRGQINVILNRLVREGAIAGFSTNFGAAGDPPPPPCITVAAPSGQPPEAVRHRVMQAVADVAIGIDVEVRPATPADRPDGRDP